MKKQLKIKSTSGRGFQAFGIMSVIFATLVSFAYLMPDDSTAKETVQASATGTVPAVTSVSVVNSSSGTTTASVHTTHMTTTAKTVTFTTTASSTLTTTSTSTTTSTTSTTTTSASTSTETTTVSTEIQTTSETETTTVSETYISETTTIQKATEPVVIFTDSEETHIHDEYCGHDDYSDYDYEYDDESSIESSGEGIYLGTFRITHYCPCASCCGEYTGLTASGTYAAAERTVSASERFDFGTQLEIDGIVYTVEDRGGFSEDTIDIFCDTHEEALEKGTYYTDVYLVE